MRKLKKLVCYREIVGRLIATVEPLSNPDTNGAEESVIVSEVSSFQRVVYTWGGKRCPV